MGRTIHGTHCILPLWCSWGEKGGPAQHELVTMWPKTGAISEWSLGSGPDTAPLESTFPLVATDAVFCPGIFVTLFSELHYCHTYQTEVSAPSTYSLKNFIHTGEVFVNSFWRAFKELITMSAHRKCFTIFLIFRVLKSMEFINVFWHVTNIFKS